MLFHFTAERRLKKLQLNEIQYNHISVLLIFNDKHQNELSINLYIFTLKTSYIYCINVESLFYYNDDI